LHVLYDNARQVPCWSAFSAANVNDITAAQALPLAPGQRYVFDKGYCDYTWWHAIDQAKSHFVTRFKGNAALRVVEERPIGEADRDTILADEIVVFRHRHNRAGHTNPYEAPLRRIVVARPDHARPLVLATNDLDSPALTISAHYKARWNIELFFKWIKQHLRLRRFLGRSERAVKIQILTALVAYLLVALAHRASTSATTLWLFLAELRAGLFQRPVSAVPGRRRDRRRKTVHPGEPWQPGLFA
jgi:IS4 transposase